jgi:hypothetical protein
MKFVPGRLVGLVVVLGLTAAGCASHPAASAVTVSKPSPATPAPVDIRAPVQIVIDGFPTENSPIYHYSIKSADDTETGVIDAHDKIAEFTETPQHYTNPSYTELTTFLLTEKKSWVRFKDTPAGASGVTRKWISFDPEKLTYSDGSPEVYTDDITPQYAYEVFQESDDISRTSPGHFRGTASLTPTDGLVTDAHLKALGSKAHAVPFTVVLDDKGRLTATTIRIPAAGKFKADTFVITYDQYGTAAVPKIPTAAEQTKTPSGFYGWFS